MTTVSVYEPQLLTGKSINVAPNLLNASGTTPKATSLELAKKRSKFKRKAVIVGIDKYKEPGIDLNGCKADADDMTNTLLVCGFPPSNIHKITNERATKARIVKELNWLVKDAKPGDVLVYYQSSHGSQLPDRNGDEPDRIDEMVILHDFNWDDEQTYMTDDDFYEFFTEKCPPGTRGEVILDTCFSGSGTKSLLFRHNMARTARYIPPKDFEHIINTRVPTKEQRSNFGFQHVGKNSVHKDTQKNITQNNVTWSACQDYQVSWELWINGQVRGAFTYNFCEIIRKREGNIRRETLFNLLRNNMALDGYEQIPDLECGSDAAFQQYAFRRNFEDDPTEISEI